MTTDVFAKERAIKGYIKDKEFFIAGVAKGAGMIHPNLATMLCFITSDVASDWAFLKKSLTVAVNDSFNLITVDGETSPNDMVVILANGLAGNEPLREGMAEAKIFEQTLTEICLHLAKDIVRNAEGATKLIEVSVEGAKSHAEARKGARAIASSPLVKAAVYGSDPNWGRVLAALGRSGIRLREEKIELYLAQLCLLKDGIPLCFDKDQARSILSQREVPLRVNLNLGQGQATAWGCDLSPEYVKINSEYTT
jgi:glutamate N-acetyltransferase/amino-acid N-acetyltransferase